MHPLSILKKTFLTFIQSVQQMGHYQTRNGIYEMSQNASTQYAPAA